MNTTNPIEDRGPVLPSPKIEPLFDQGPEKGQKTSGVGKKLALAAGASLGVGTCCVLPKAGSDWQMMLVILDLFGATSKAATLLGERGAQLVPCLNLFAAPTYLYHAASKAYTRFSLMVSAFKVGRVADGFFWGARGMDSLCTAVGTISKSTSGVCQLLGWGTQATFGLIFAVILPIVMLILGTIGGIAQGVLLWKNYQGLKHFNETRGEGSLKSLVETLNYLQGPRQSVLKADLGTDQAAQKCFHEVGEQTHICTHFSSEERYESLSAKLDALRASLSTQKQLLQTKESSFNQAMAGFEQVQGIFERLLEAKPGEEFSLIEEMKALYDKLLDMPHLPGELKALIEKNRAELTAVIREGNALVQMSRSDMERALCYNALFLLLSLIFVTNGILMLASPEHAAIASYMAIGSALLEIGYVLFDKTVSMEQFDELRKLMQTSKN